MFKLVILLFFGIFSLRSFGDDRLNLNFSHADFKNLYLTSIRNSCHEFAKKYEGLGSCDDLSFSEETKELKNEFKTAPASQYDLYFNGYCSQKGKPIQSVMCLAQVSISTKNDAVTFDVTFKIAKAKNSK